MAESAESMRISPDPAQPGALARSAPGSPVGRPQLTAPGSDQISMAAILAMMWAHRWLVLTLMLLCGAAAAYLAFTAPRTYTAEVVTVPANTNTEEAGGALARRLGEIVNVGGINLGNNDTQRYANAVLESRRLVEEYIRRNDLIPQLSAGGPRLDMWRAERLFQRGLLVIRRDTRKEETTISIEWRDPAIAAKWANGFVALANELVRTRALEESKRNIAYLEAQVEHTNDVDLRRVLYSLIQNETKNLMLANERAEYAFRIVDSAVPPEIPSGPHRKLMLAAGLLTGLFLGGLVAYVRTTLMPPRRAR